MSDRLPPEIAALLTDGEQLVVGDLVLADVRRLLVVVAAKLANQRGVIRLLESDLAAATAQFAVLTEVAAEYKDSGKRDLMRARRAESALRALVTLKAIKEQIDARPNQTLHHQYLLRKPIAWQAARDALATIPPAAESCGLAPASDNAVSPTEGVVVEGPQG